ncbi:MAG: SGNH/GDSL hydrolase family protein [Microcoleaceae cyanobacterium]
MTAFHIEAETFSSDGGYVTKSRDFADGGQLIHLTELQGTATTSFSATAGTYDVILHHYDESDGQGSVKITIGGSEQVVTLDQDNAGSRLSANNKIDTSLFQGLQINPGDNIEIVGFMNGAETVAIDGIEFVPVVVDPVDTIAPTATLAANNFTTNLNSADPYTFTVTFSDNEAIDVSTLDTAITVQYQNQVNQTVNFAVDDINFAVDDNSDGSPRVATYTLDAPGGSWDTNEAGTYIVSVAGTALDTSRNPVVAGPLGSFEVNVESDPPTMGETESYASSTQPVLARLDQDFAIQLEYGESFKLMPLGDSITAGKEDNTQNEADREGYRRFLYEDLTALGLNVDFVGSKSNGRDGFVDKDHQGDPGIDINGLARSVTNVTDAGEVGTSIQTNNPDIVLMMIGTNSMGGLNPEAGLKSAEKLDENLTRRLFQQLSPESHLIVSSIPPVTIDRDDPTDFQEDTKRTNDIEAFNAELPGIVDKYQDDGKNISFVDIRAGDNAITEADMSPLTVDNGLHPTAGGYRKIADFYYDAVLDAVGTRSDLTNVSNIVGSDFNDTIVGNDSNNEILGGEEDDELTGGGGADKFIYTELADGSDILTDFNPAEGDIFQIQASGFVGSGLTAGVALSNGTASATGVFVSGVNPQPIGNSANLLYDTSTGVLSMDIDGVGNQNSVILATLEGIPALSANQFEIA